MYYPMWNDKKEDGICNEMAFELKKSVYKKHNFLFFEEIVMACNNSCKWLLTLFLAVYVCTKKASWLENFNSCMV